MLPRRTRLFALLLMCQAEFALSTVTQSTAPLERKLIRGRALHGYLLSLAKTGQQPVTGVQRPKAGGELDTKIPGTLQDVDLSSCAQGGTPAVDLSQAVPATQTYQPGESITVAWKTTIPHDNAPGVRIAVRYVNKPGDTFASHILANNQNGAQDGNSVVQLPNTQGRAELMWSWASTQDGGYYVSCADIVIGLDDTPGQANNGNNGNTGNNQNNNVVGATPSSSAQAGLIDETASTAVIVISILVIVAVVVCVGYTAVNSGGNSAPPLGQGGKSGAAGGRSLPRPASQRPKSVARGLRAAPAGGLPPGWASAVDGDGDTYYYHQDGRTSWEVPTS